MTPAEVAERVSRALETEEGQRLLRENVSASQEERRRIMEAFAVDPGWLQRRVTI